MSNFFLRPFTLLFEHNRSKARSMGISKITSLKPIQGAIPKNPSPRATRAKLLVSNMIAEANRKAVPEAKG